MTPAPEPQSAPPVLRIQGELSIYRAAELKHALLDDPAPTEVDLSGVTEIDTAGVQLLMLAKRTAQARRCELRLVAHSAAVSEAFELLNLSSYFDDPLVMAERSNTAGRRSHES